MHGAVIIGRVLSIECKMVAIISTASKAQAKNGANPIEVRIKKKTALKNQFLEEE